MISYKVQYKALKDQGQGRSLWRGFTTYFQVPRTSVTVVLSSILRRSKLKDPNYCHIASKRLLKASRTSLFSAGEENLEPGKSYIIMSNHTSLLDLPAIVMGPKKHRVFLIAKEGLFQVPLLGTAMRRAGFIAINRKKSRRAREQLQATITQFSKGDCIWISPGGTRTREAYLPPLKKGGFHLATSLKVPIIPMWISGAGEVAPPGSLRVSPNQNIYVLMGPPICVEKYNKANLSLLAEKTRAAMLDLSSQHQSFLNRNANRTMV